MRTLQLLWLLTLLLPVVGRAETNACVPAGNIIIAPGSYCLTAVFTPVSPGGITIDIGSNDVTLDCNGFRVLGPVIAPDLVTTDTTVGIYIGTSNRVTVRNCRVVGHQTGIFVGRAEDGLERSRDVTLENNTLENNGRAIFYNDEGTSLIRNNVVTGAQLRGFEAYAAPGQVTIRDNVVLRAGDTTFNQGRGGYFSSELGGWMIVQDNVFSEIIAPSGTAGAPAVRLGPGGGVRMSFSGNRILAPANPAEKGTVTVAIDNSGGNACDGNLIVGYGTAAIPNCPVPANEQR